MISLQVGRGSSYLLSINFGSLVVLCFVLGCKGHDLVLCRLVVKRLDSTSL